jgi:hypothetical protein
MVFLDSRRISRVPRYSGTDSTKTHAFRLRGSHPLWQRFPAFSTKRAFCQTPRAPLQKPQVSPPTPMPQQCKLITRHRFGLFPLRSPLLRESLLFSFPPGTEMVQFPGFRFRTLCIHVRMTGMTPAGLPHSVIPGSRDVCSSPGLFAAYHDLPRQTAPRHPP